MRKLSDYFYGSAALLPLTFVLGFCGEVVFGWFSSQGIGWIDMFVGKAIPLALVLVLYWMICIQVLGWRYLKEENIPFTVFYESRIKLSIIIAPFVELFLIVFVLSTVFGE